MKPSRPARNAYCLLLYMATLPLTAWFAWRNDGGTGLFRVFYLLSTWLAYTGIILIPAFLAAAGAYSRKLEKAPAWMTRTGKSLTVLLAFLTHLLLLADALMLAKFGYHVNGLVINLLTTPGGFESMGLESNTLLAAALGMMLLLAMHGGIMALATSCRRRNQAVSSRWTMAAARWGYPLLTTTALLFSLLSTGLADFQLNQNVLCSLDAYPFAPTMRMRHFLRRMGMQEPDRTELPQLARKNDYSGHVTYPLLPIARQSGRSRPNIVWLVGESLRADLLAPEIMPATWKLSARGWRFTQHYSGGHGTRQGMFTMFYGLYGNGWDKFLRSQRAPLLFDWLREDDYQFFCQTAARFSYPEFDRTIFSSLPASALYEDNDGKAWERDSRLADRVVDFLASREQQRPFFVFCFFESTHAPYTFSPENPLRQDFLPSINYATVSAKDAPRVYNRAVNAAHHLDNQLARIFAALENSPGLLDNTMVIITGDHGEEFYENGFLGHNSTFVQEQIQVPLVILAPGVKPSVYTDMSHHTDIVPSLAPWLGIVNPPADYAVGGNLFSPDYHRSHLIVSGWETAALVTTTQKLILPLGTKGSYFQRKITTLDDQPCKNAHDFYQANIKTLQQAQRDMFRFIEN